jgi:hypothetical protein
MHFLIGLILAIVALWMVIATLSHPAGRAGCLVVAGLGALVVLAALSGGNRSSAPAPRPEPPEVVAARQAAAEREVRERRERIPVAQVTVRDIRIEQFGRNILEQPPSPGNEDFLTLHATLRNGSEEHRLLGVVVAARLYDCPPGANRVGPSCDLVQDLRQRLETDVPPGQTRDARSSQFGFHNFPRLHGRLAIDYEIVSTDAVPAAQR